MTLKEKFEQYAYYSDGNYSMNVQYQKEDNAIEIEQIADEFAIGFAEWLTYNRENNYTKSIKELLEIYKKEKEL